MVYAPRNFLVGQVNTHMETRLVMRAFENTLDSQKPNKGLILHSDR